MKFCIFILTTAINLPCGGCNSHAFCEDDDLACSTNLVQVQSRIWRSSIQATSNEQKTNYEKYADDFTFSPQLIRKLMPKRSDVPGDLSKATCESFGWKKANHSQVRVIDGYAYNGEAIMAKARYEELKDYINGTGILITDANFKGEIKDPVEAPNVPSSQVVRLPGTKFETCGSSNQEGFNYCVLSLTKNSIAIAIERFKLNDDDWVIFSDPDEIPDRELIRLLHECEVPVGPNQDSDHIRLNAAGHYMYTFDCSFQKSNWRLDNCTSNCKGPVVIRAGTMRKQGLRTFQAQVAPWCVKKGPYATCEKHPRKMLLQNTFWHLSSFGGPDMFSKKMSDNSDAFNHSRKDLADIKDVAKKCIDLDDERKNPDMKLKRDMANPLVYPWIPHSVAESTNLYQEFFTWESQGQGALEEEGIFYSRKRLEEMRQAIKTNGLGKIRNSTVALLDRLASDANVALAQGPWRVTDKSGRPPSGNLRDYFDGSKYKYNADGSRMDELIDVFALEEVFDRARFSYMVRNTTILALAYKVFGNYTYCTKAAANIEAFYTGEDGVSPHMKFTHYDAEPRQRFHGIIGWKDHYFLLDAANMVKECYKDGKYEALRAWARTLMHWLQDDTMGIEEGKSLNNHGTWYDVLLLSLARFTSSSTVDIQMRRSIYKRLMDQVTDTGDLPFEMLRSNCMHYQMFGLQALVTLSHMAKLSEGQLLHKALQYNVPHLNKTWNKCNDVPMSPIQNDATRFDPLWMMAAADEHHLVKSEFDLFAEACSKNPLFHDDAGIAPYWQLALESSV